MSDPAVYTAFIAAMTAAINASDASSGGKSSLITSLGTLAEPLRLYITPGSAPAPVVTTSATQASTTNAAALDAQVFFRTNAETGITVEITGWATAAAAVSMPEDQFRTAISKGPVTNGVITVSQFRPEAETKFGRRLITDTE